MMKGNMVLAILMGAMLMGCVSQQAHERALEKLAMTSQSSAQEEVKRLQQVVQEKEAAVVQLEEEKQVIEEALGSHEMKVNQLEEENQAFEETLKKELQALYSQVAGLEGLSGAKAVSFSGRESDEVDFDDLAQAFRDVRSALASQMSNFSELRDQNGQLEEELQKLEARLQHVERLKKELEQVRADREAQEAKLAKVRHEVQTVGKEIDRITKALEEKFGKSLVVTQHQDRLVLTMLGQVLFESGKAQLTPLGLDIMKQVGEVLATLPNKNIQVEGHTDNNPIYGRLQQQYPTNWELSTARATTVLRYLIEQTGMNPEDFAATGYAATRPAVGNDSEEGRAQNRRVEIVLYPERMTQENDTVATITH